MRPMMENEIVTGIGRDQISDRRHKASRIQKMTPMFVVDKFGSRALNPLIRSLLDGADQLKGYVASEGQNPRVLKVDPLTTP